MKLQEVAAKQTIASGITCVLALYLDVTFPADQWEIWALKARQMMQTPGVAYFRKRTKTYEDLFAYLEQMPESSPKPLALELGSQ